jgi:hypothetical protein
MVRTRWPTWRQPASRVKFPSNQPDASSEA